MFTRVLGLYVASSSKSYWYPDSKHWFTTSFLQPLPYLVTPLGPENCQLTSSFFVAAQTVVINFVTNNSDCIRRLFYN